MSREAAWDAVHDLLPAGWRVGPPTFDPATQRWSVTARSPTRGRRRPPETISGDGEKETAALTELGLRLEEFGRADRMETVRRRLRMAYLAGAEEWSREAMRRPLTAEEAAGVFGRYPGDR